MRALEDKTFLLLLAAVTLAFAWVLWPYFGAILWGTVIAILFAPLYRWLVKILHKRRNLAAFATVLIILVMVILPLTLVAASLAQEATGVYSRIQSGELNVGRYLRQVFDALPPWAAGLLERFGLTDLGTVQARLSGALAKGSQFIASQLLHIGQNTFEFIVGLFVMLYLLFFLLRDGDALARQIRDAIPLRDEQRRGLAEKLTTVVRATMKGTVVVAIVQGALGGLIFWILGVQPALLWGVLMGVLSLLPAVGTPVVWVPVAIYLFATGALWQAIVLVAFGVLVIGLVDNLLRPVLVGKDTRMPDYVVLISTLGGIVIFGFNGFVIGPLIAALFMACWAIFATSRPGAR